jgi:hypothetical protein
LVDKVKSLKIEDATDGTEIDMAPTEVNPSEDYLAAKGVAFENSDDTVIYGESGQMRFKDVDVTTEVTLEDLLDGGNGASPGFSFGRRGNVAVNTWLRNEEVPSNRTGRVIAVNNPEAVLVSLANRNVTTYTVTFFEHDGNLIGLTSLGSVTVTSARGDDQSISVALTQGKQLAARLTAGTSVQDLVVTVTVKGTV